jgi:hypothetical protein
MLRDAWSHTRHFAYGSLFLRERGIDMSKKQSAALERKKFFSDPILISMIAVLLVSGTVYFVSASHAAGGQFF